MSWLMVVGSSDVGGGWELVKKDKDRRTTTCAVCDHRGDGDEDAQMAGVVGSSGVGGGW